jgi:membrane-associated phospholipid phosphatase
LNESNLKYSIFIVAIAVLNLITPFHQEFSLRNFTLQYKYAVHERVPSPLLYTCSIAAPAAIIALYTLVIDGIFSHQAGGHKRRYKLKDRLWELNCGILGLLLANGAAYIITGTFKNTIGKPRPDLIDRCQPSVTTDPQPFGLSNSTICKQTDKSLLNDGFMSFPSGHSSTSFSGLFYLSLYLAGKLHILDAKGEVWRVLIVTIPTIGASLIAGSRIMDARHHPFDVISGSLLGILVAWGSYRQYFPQLSEWRAKGRAYPIRSWGKPLSETNHSISMKYTDAPTHDEENDGQTHYVSGRFTPPEEQQPRTGNVFRDELSRSQRHRTQASGDIIHVHMPESQPPRKFPNNTVQHSSHPSQSSLAPFMQHSTNHHGMHDPTDIWDASSEEEEAGYELEPTYTLSHPAVNTGYDTGYEQFRTTAPQQLVSTRIPHDGGAIQGAISQTESTSNVSAIPVHGQFGPSPQLGSPQHNA